MRRLLLVTTPILLLAGCFDGGGGDDPAGDGDGEAPGGDVMDGDDAMGGEGDGDDNGTANPPNPRRDPVTWHLTIQGNDFVDGSITLQAGDTVVWTHQDGSTPHTVTADDGSFDSGACPGTACMTQLANAEFSFTFNEVGEFPYHCEVHPSMTDTITVLESYDGIP